ncbi:MAG: DinB family protein [Saprospiraceae bacterium]
MNFVQSTSLAQIAATAIHDLRLYLSLIEPTVYSQQLELLSGSTIGQHTRHILEFYQCLTEQSLAEGPVINYARRRRDYRIETDPAYALQLSDVIVTQLDHLNETQSCQLNCEEHGQENLLIESTIGRELIYNIEHTIHHLAIVKIELRHAMPSLDLPTHFGVAPSTIRHRHEACAQ